MSQLVGILLPLTKPLIHLQCSSSLSSMSWSMTHIIIFFWDDCFKEGYVTISTRILTAPMVTNTDNHFQKWGSFQKLSSKIEKAQTLLGLYFSSCSSHHPFLQFFFWQDLDMETEILISTTFPCGRDYKIFDWCWRTYAGIYLDSN